MMKFFNLFTFLLVILLSIFQVSANVYNQNGEFSITTSEIERVVVNDDINTQFAFTITNNENFKQDILIEELEVQGWDLTMTPMSFTLTPGAQRRVVFTLSANSDFDYSQNIISSTEIVLSKSDYRGLFEFPVTIRGENEVITVRFEVEIVPQSDLLVSFEPRITQKKLSPVSPLTYSIDSTNIADSQSVLVIVELGDNQISRFEQVFSEEAGAYQVFSQDISSSIVPGTYTAKVTVRQDKGEGNIEEWYAVRELEVVPYENIVISEESSSSIFKEEFLLSVSNKGNQKSTFTKEIEMSFFDSLFFGTNLKETKSGDVVVLSADLESGEQISAKYYYNYLSLYLVLLAFLIIIMYIYVRKNSNPIDVETKIYGVKRVAHEGIKEVKVRFGFENIKLKQIDQLKVTFRMPSYLHVKEDSFVLTEPNHVLKGSSQYKLIWDFRNFEKSDSRIIGFTLLNKRGVLGDIRFGNLEFEVKVDGKTRKYYESFPIIRG